MFQRLDNFPKISAKNHLKLRELGDLLAEIQGAKEDGYLTGLSYLAACYEVSAQTRGEMRRLEACWSGMAFLTE